MKMEKSPLRVESMIFGSIPSYRPLYLDHFRNSSSSIKDHLKLCDEVAILVKSLLEEENDEYPQACTLSD